MNILSSGEQIQTTLIELARRAKQISIAVAWATTTPGFFRVLVNSRKKINRLVIGTHFYQTDPRVLEIFSANRHARYILKPDGIFHPKMYFFMHSQKRWDCIIGSANLTLGGLDKNEECCVHVSSSDLNADVALSRIKKALEKYWVSARRPTREQIAAYRKRYELKAKLRKSLGDVYGENERQSGHSVLDVPILRMEWKTYVNELKSDRECLKIRIGVLNEANLILRNAKYFHDLDHDDRRRISGTVSHQGEDHRFLWFGSMIGAGRLRKAIKDNNRNLSMALDQIPNTGNIERAQFEAFRKHLKKAFPEGGVGVAVASRFLALKRPDHFVCLDSKNRRLLADAFGIKAIVSLDEYWELIIERIRDSTWWQHPQPAAKTELEIWKCRAALRKRPVDHPLPGARGVRYVRGHEQTHQRTRRPDTAHVLAEGRPSPAIPGQWQHPGRILPQA